MVVGVFWISNGNHVVSRMFKETTCELKVSCMCCITFAEFEGQVRSPYKKKLLFFRGFRELFFVDKVFPVTFAVNTPYLRSFFSENESQNNLRFFLDERSSGGFSIERGGTINYQTSFRRLW